MFIMSKNIEKWSKFWYDNRRLIIGGIAVDPITQKFLGEFCKSFEIDENKTDTSFEHFCNYCCVNKENGIVDIKLEEMSTGKNAQGIDGIAIIVNHKLVTSISEIEFQIQNSRVLDVNFVFIQAKTSSSFDNTLMLNFFEFTKAFFEGDGSEFITPEIQNFFDMKQFIYDNAEYMTESNPKLSMYYVTTGKWVNDKTLVKVKDRNEKELQNLNDYIGNMNHINGGNSPKFEKTGTYTFDGNQAVAYSRIRYMEGGDHARANHQRLVLEGIMNTAKKQPLKLGKLISTVLPQCKTSLSNDDLTKLTLSMARCKIEDSQAYPFKSEDERYNGIYYGFPITAQTNVKKAHEYLFGTKDYKPTEELQKISAKIKVVTDYIGITE